MTSLSFDPGTAYDFFISLTVLHEPEDFGLRSQWAAGVRFRLPPLHRATLEKMVLALPAPLFWLNGLDSSPKDSGAVITALQALPPAERLLAVSYQPEASPRFRTILENMAAGGRPSQAELDYLRAELARRGHSGAGERVSALADIWSHADEFGEALLEALESYRSAFFAEEEERIQSVLEAGIRRARDLAGQVTLEALIDDLTRGVIIEPMLSVDELVLAASFWSSPLIYYGMDQPRKAILVFGCRSDGQGIIPGEPVPAGLVIGLKALGDPTRLRILHYLADAPLTPAQLSRRLRLRPPTIIHHLQAMRLAGLVQISMDSSGDRRYALRRGALKSVLDGLQDFIDQPVDQEND